MMRRELSRRHRASSEGGISTFEQSMEFGRRWWYTDRNDEVKGIRPRPAQLVGPILQPRCVRRILSDEAFDVEALVVLKRLLDIPASKTRIERKAPPTQES